MTWMAWIVHHGAHHNSLLEEFFELCVPVSASVPGAVPVPVLVSVSASVLVSMSVSVPWAATDSVSTAGPRPVTWALWASGQHPSDLDVSTVSEVLVNSSAAR